VNQHHQQQTPALSDDQRAEIREAFELFDTDKDGMVDYHELKVAMRALGFDLKKAEVLKLLRENTEPGGNLMSWESFEGISESELLVMKCGEDVDAGSGRKWVNGGGRSQAMGTGLSTRTDMSSDTDDTGPGSSTRPPSRLSAIRRRWDRADIAQESETGGQGVGRESGRGGTVCLFCPDSPRRLQGAGFSDQDVLMLYGVD
jgi:hypothetical protein